MEYWERGRPARASCNGEPTLDVIITTMRFVANKPWWKSEFELSENEELYFALGSSRIGSLIAILTLPLILLWLIVRPLVLWVGRRGSRDRQLFRIGTSKPRKGLRKPPAKT